MINNDNNNERRRFLRGRVPNTDSDAQGPDFDDMSSFFPCEIGDTIQYI